MVDTLMLPPSPPAASCKQKTSPTHNVATATYHSHRKDESCAPCRLFGAWIALISSQWLAEVSIVAPPMALSTPQPSSCLDCPSITADEAATGIAD